MNDNDPDPYPRLNNLLTLYEQLIEKIKSGWQPSEEDMRKLREALKELDMDNGNN